MKTMFLLSPPMASDPIRSKNFTKENIKALNKEARQWDKETAREKPEVTARLLEEAEPFVA
jgi:hypothetical protein